MLSHVITAHDVNVLISVLRSDEEKQRKASSASLISSIQRMCNYKVLAAWLETGGDELGCSVSRSRNSCM